MRQVADRRVPPCARLAFALACAVAVTAQPKFQLTVDSIMRGPGLVGYEPRHMRWSGSGDRVWFEWKLAADPVRSDPDTYVVNRDGSALRKLTPEERKLVPPAQDRFPSKDRRFTTYAIDGDIWLYDHSTDKGRALTSTVEPESNPRVLRDGRRVAFTRANNLFVMSMEDGSVVQLTDIKPPGAPVPPDEKKGTASQEYVKAEERALIEAVREGALKKDEDEARKKKANPRKPLRLAARQSVTSLELSPDGKLVSAIISEAPENRKEAAVPNYVTQSAYMEPIPSRIKVGDADSTSRLALIDVVTGDVKYVDTGLRRADASKEQKDRELYLTMPEWSDDGAKAYITASARDNKDRWLLALDTSTGKTRVLATDHDDAWVNDRSTSGWMKGDREIFFLSERDGYSHLYTVPWDGGEPRQLTSGKWEVLDASLSRDKDRFFLETNESHFSERQLYVMDASGGVRRRISTALLSQDERSGPAVSPDEQSVAVVYSYVNRPPELFIQPMNGAAIRVTTSPLPEFSSYPWQDAPIVSIPARDGVNVPGRLYKPHNAARGGPAVIFVHGAGYLQNIHRSWSNYYREYMFHHLLMERGYTVLDIDYRGSANYGRDWRTAIYRHMGGKDLEDHVDAAKWLVAQHGVNPKRIGIYGGSYGGFITLMAMFRHADTFAAGAALRPVTDWAHYNHPYTSNILNSPQDDPEAYKRSSPIYFADGLKGALLMCHGMVDTNVHVQDTVRLAQRLIELRKENWEMALYPVENHAFVQPSSWADEYKRILKLFETHLK